MQKESQFGNHRGANKIFKVAFIVFAFIGLLGTFLLFSSASVIANEWLEIPEAEMTLVALSPAIFFVAVSSVMRGYFNGRKNLEITAKTQFIEQFFKTGFTILIVELVAIFTNTSTKFMAAGANIATTLATFSSFSYLLLYYNQRKSEIAQEIKSTINYKYEKVHTILKNVLLVSIPMTISSILSSVTKNIDAFTVNKILSTYLPPEIAIEKYGILGGKIETLIALPLSFNMAFSTALIPTISAAIAKRNTETAKNTSSFSILISILIGLPCTLGFCIFAQPILNLLYPNANSGALLLQIASISIIFSLLIQTTNGALQGFGKFFIPTLSLGIGVVIKLILNLILLRIPKLNIYGASIGTACCNIISFVIAFVALKKIAKLKISFSKFILKPIVANFIMGICSYFIFMMLNCILAENLATIISILSAIAIYFISIIVLKIFTKEELYLFPFGQNLCFFLEKLRIY
ncbi:MAG: hypothetical protein HFJ47_02665 [Clostridia bacterium]|nr:hypothetical protein [Clostridia bacterium]